MATIEGTPGNDTLFGTPDDDRIEGYNVQLNGADRVNLLGGQDYVVVTGPTLLTLDPRQVGNGIATDVGGDGGLAVRYQSADAAGNGVGAVARFDDEGTSFATSQGGSSQDFVTVRDLVTGRVLASGVTGVSLGSSADDYLFAGNTFSIQPPGAGGLAIGGAGNDSFGSRGPARVIGGTGVDTFFVNSNTTSTTNLYSVDADNHVVVDVQVGGRFSTTTVTLEGIERLQFFDRLVSNDDGRPLVDDIFYFATNADIRAAGLDADDHYAQFGARELRDPNAYFSTAGYLAANADVRAADANPLAHYDSTGWREGRDPSADFDTGLYLKNNQDVAQAGVDPLAHFLQFGQDEGRATYAAIGVASSFTRGSFDGEFYLLANPDVARAAIATGGDPGTFAFAHFNDFGWKEGRDPNSVFNTGGYLDAYKDVAAAGINPLTHYDLFGWKEGRDPSTSFDTKSYLAANPDVIAAGVNPLTHYLQFGALEGRSTFDDGVFG